MAHPKLTKTIPKAPGVYYFKNKEGVVIYVGKAKSLHARVSSYFQKTTDWKVKLLIEEHADIDYILTKNETEALLLEAQMVGEHKPKFNVLLKDGQPFLFIKFTTQETMPRIEVVRNKKGKGTFFGPFLHKRQARGVAQYLTETFRLNICNKKIANGCLDFHLGRCSGTCMIEFDLADYLFRIELAMDVLKNNHKQFLKNVKEKITEYNKQLAFENSKRLNEYLQNFDVIFETIKTRFHEEKYATDIFVATTPTAFSFNPELEKNLQEFLHLDQPIRTIDCFDISHFQSSYLVGSCVRFIDGKPDKNNLRKFKIKTLIEQNDYAALQEIVSRRYREPFSIPDLVVIDGGKGQLSAVQQILPEATVISLAKREETIFSKQFPEGKRLDIHSQVGQLLIALRDYAHHFAVSYHKVRRSNDLRDTIRKKK
jgi:excinuclease ABC subunit C